MAMKYKKYLFILTVVLLSSHCFSMTADEILNKLRSKYSTASKIEYKTVYELFKNHQSSEIVTSYNGYVYRQGNLMYQKIHHTEFVYGADFSLKINSDEKVIQLNKKQQTLELELNLDEVLKECKEKSVKEIDNYYSVTLLFKQTSLLPLSVMKIRIDKGDFRLLQLDLYYATHQDFSTDYRVTDLQRPHLRIRFTDITFSPSDNKQLFNLGRYIETRKNYLYPSAIYKHYSLSDLRL